jgi:uncharacterized protein (TIGR02996 family)
MTKARQEQAFLDAVLADPSDRAARLVYADWLEEQAGGEPGARLGARGALLAEALRRPGRYRLVTRCGLLGLDYLVWFPGRNLERRSRWKSPGWPLGVVPCQACACRERRHATYHRGRHWLCFFCVGRYDADPAAWEELAADAAALEAARALPPPTQ